MSGKIETPKLRAHLILLHRVSTSTDLSKDAKRDLNDIGCFLDVIEGCQELEKGKKV